MTNLDKFPLLNYHKILNFPFLFPLLEFQKKFPPINKSHLKSWSPPPLQSGGRKPKIYSSKELESIFIELLIPNKQNYIIRTVYKHPPMQHFKFNELMRNLLAKINHENKKNIIAGDFNLNLLKYMQKRGIHEFLECLLRKNFLP